MRLRRNSTAEFRGPGVRHNFEDSGDDYDLDLDQRTRGIGGRSGRIILLGDGTEVLTESDETEMFDHEEEDKDLESQVSKGQTKPKDENRGVREETPGPEAPTSAEKQQQTTVSTERNPFDTTSSTTSEKPDSTNATNNKVIPVTAIPEKLVASPASQEK